MATVTLDFPPDVLAALKKSPEEFAEEVRIAAVVQWYAEGVVSQGKAASIAGLSREAFIEELYRRKVLERGRHGGQTPARSIGRG